MHTPQQTLESRFAGSRLRPSAGPSPVAWNLPTMDEALILETARQLASRERQVRAASAAARAVLPGAGLALLLVFVLKVLGESPWGGLAPLVLIPAGAALARRLAPLDPVASAYRADHRLGLQERLGTAVEWLLSDRPRTLMAHVMLHDTADRARRVLPHQAFPQPWPGRLRTGLLLGCLAVVLAGLPADTMVWGHPDPEILAAVRRQAGELSREILSQRRLADAPGLRDLEARLAALELDLERPGLDPREALERLSALAEELRRHEQAGSGLAGGASSASQRVRQAEEARRLRELARNLESPGAAEDLRRVAHDPQSSADARQAAAQALEAMEQGDDLKAREILVQGADRPASGQARDNPGRDVRPGRHPGEGRAQADFGQGTTMEEQPGSSSRPTGYVLERQAPGTSRWSEEYRRLHPPRRDNLPTADIRVPGQVGRGPTLLETGQGLGAPAAGGQAARPAGDAWQPSREAAEQAVTREALPVERRGLVRDYFEGIDPRP